MVLGLLSLWRTQYSRGSRKTSSWVTVQAMQAMGIASAKSHTSCSVRGTLKRVILRLQSCLNGADGAAKLQFLNEWPCSFTTLRTAGSLRVVAMSRNGDCWRKLPSAQVQKLTMFSCGRKL